MQYTPEQEQDVRDRTEAFKADYLQLVEKHQVDFLAYPQLIPNESGQFVTVASLHIGDKKYAPVPSPDETI